MSSKTLLLIGRDQQTVGFSFTTVPKKQVIPKQSLAIPQALACNLKPVESTVRRQTHFSHHN